MAEPGSELTRLVRTRPQSRPPTPGRRLRVAGPRTTTETSAWRSPGVALALLGGVCLTLALFAISAWSERQRQSMAFERQATLAAASLRTGFELPLEVLVSLALLFEASEEVTREEFRSFVTPSLRRHPAVYAYEWLPLVGEADRTAVERRMRDDGFPSFQFQELDTHGRLTPAGIRAEYLPVLYMEPLVESVLGFDPVSDPERGLPALLARKEGKPVLSARQQLVEDAAGEHSVIAFQPVFRGERAVGRQFMGLTAMVLRVRPVVEASLGGFDLSGLRVAIADQSAPLSHQLLYERSSGDATAMRASTWMRAFPMVLAGRKWSVGFAPVRTPRWPRSMLPWMLLASGLTLTATLATGLAARVTVAGLRRKVERALELGQYRLGQPLGEGGMGVVYEARHRLLARPAAIKLIRPETLGDDPSGALVQRFEREARATAALQSRHTVQIYDFGQAEDGSFYLVMERLHGHDLETLVQKFGPLSPGRVIFLWRQICHSLAEAHAAGLIHRDLKPANIYVCREGLDYDFVKVLDFGLVKTAQDDAARMHITASGLVVGTPSYMAPEAFFGAATVATDLFATGCIAYWMLTGRRAFPSDLSTALTSARRYQPPVPPSTAAPDAVPASLDAVVRSCLAAEAADRPADATELDRLLVVCERDASWTAENAREWWMTRLPEHSQPAASAAVGTFVSGVTSDRQDP
jgi:serine/threonine protein kinase/CHASE1-domain containing sensor protein